MEITTIKYQLVTLALTDKGNEFKVLMILKHLGHLAPGSLLWPFPVTRDHSTAICNIFCWWHLLPVFQQKIPIGESGFA